MTESATGDRRRALVALALLAPVPSLGVWMAMVVAPGPIGKTVFTVGKLWLVAFPAAWWILVERGKLSWSPPRRGGLAIGAVIGILSAAVIVAVYALFAAPRMDPTLLREALVEMGLDHRGLYLAGAAYWIFVNSVLEEYVYRWFVFRQCEYLLGAVPAVAASAVIFTLHHIIALTNYLDPLLTTLASLGVFIGGAIWSWCYLRFRSIWPGWIAHAGADVAIFAIGWHIIFG